MDVLVRLLLVLAGVGWPACREMIGGDLDHVATG
jgi:hypothetical protein